MSGWSFVSVGPNVGAQDTKAILVPSGLNTGSYELPLPRPSVFSDSNCDDEVGGGAGSPALASAQVTVATSTVAIRRRDPITTPSARVAHDASGTVPESGRSAAARVTAYRTCAADPARTLRRMTRAERLPPLRAAA
jgi:hypothetical protein